MQNKTTRKASLKIKCIRQNPQLRNGDKSIYLPQDSSADLSPFIAGRVKVSDDVDTAALLVFITLLKVRKNLLITMQSQNAETLF